MKIVVRPERGWGRVTFKVPDETFEEIKRLAEEYGFRLDEVLRIILLHGYTEGAEGDIEALDGKIAELERKLYRLEGDWSPLRFRAYYLAMDNQNLAIQLSGMLAENRRLRERLGLPFERNPEVEEKIHYYLSFEEDSVKESGPEGGDPGRLEEHGE